MEKVRLSKMLWSGYPWLGWCGVREVDGGVALEQIAASVSRSSASMERKTRADTSCLLRVFAAGGLAMKKRMHRGHLCT